MDTSFSIPGFIGHPSNYVYDEHEEHPSFFLYYTVSFGWICVSQGEGRSTILSLEFSIPSFSSIPLPSNHISSFPRMGGDEKGNEDGEVLFSQSKVYRYMGQLVWRG